MDDKNVRPIQVGDIVKTIMYGGTNISSFFEVVEDKNHLAGLFNTITVSNANQWSNVILVCRSEHREDVDTLTQ